MQSKDIVIGGAVAASLISNLVYTHHRCKQLQNQIDELRKETKTLAQYVNILESKITNNNHHRHEVQAPANQPQNPNPAVAHASNHQPVPIRRTVPATAATRVAQPPARQEPIRRQAKQEEEESDSPPNSNRRVPAKPVAPRTRYQPPPQEESSSSSDEKDEPGPQAPQAERPKAPVKRFQPPPDEDNTPKVSSKRAVTTPKSILKQPVSGTRPQNGTEASEKGKEEVDDILGEIEQMAKSSNRKEKDADENEGREKSKTDVRARMERTRLIAAQMQKKREAKNGVAEVVK